MARDSDLAFFVAVVKAGSLTAAARELDVTTPAVSKRLAALEARLGVRLLNRTTRRLSATHEGDVYLEQARHILGEIEDLERRVSSSRAAPQGLLRVNAPLGFGRTHIGPAVSEFAKRFADVEVQLTLTDRPLVLADQSIDVGIRFGRVPDSRMIARRIAMNRRLVSAAPSYLARAGTPRIPRDLLRHECIRLRQNDASHSLWEFSRGNREYPVKVGGRLVSNDGEVTLRWALEGHGVLVRAEWDIAKHLRSGRLVQLLEDYPLPEADIYAVYPQRHHLSAKVIAFIDFVTERFARHARLEGAKEPW